MEAVIAAAITGAFSVLGIVISNAKSNQKMESKIEQQLNTAQAVTDCKIEELTREVREHNNFAKRVPVLEEQVKVANHRIADLENQK
ncbi:hypothetical protein LG34_13445 [Eubacterium ramulus]|jgi:hypothetical protein|uniref:Uncharacterized protein n=1 Tax=Eubacterium ramulus TaxID=39490 RepID=A0A2V1JQ51_EUBRA|nr:hypothetical protein [Eubacterium ramulus]PWE85874.1 hypothetical protein LG34_13445 [Eubacterium ramulus]DAM88006.1 MAG TPA: hypothetical protein [Caudoviricetes sp.]